MQVFSYTVSSIDGLSASSAGLLVKTAAESGCTVTIGKGGKSVNAKKLYAIIGLDVKQGDEITLTVSGPDESDTANRIKELLLSTV